MQTIDEIVAERDTLAAKYEGGLPSYLQDFFDNKIKQLKIGEKIAERKRFIYATSKEDRRNYIDGKNGNGSVNP